VKVIVDLEKEFIKEEGPAILRWIIDGAVDRESTGSLYVAQVILDDTADYMAEENVMDDFISGYLIPAPADADPIWRVKTSEVYASWKAYCGQFGRSAGDRNTFTTAIKAAGVTYQRTGKGRYFLNVRLRITPFTDE
jgi:putative DNA primase/helicase